MYKDLVRDKKIALAAGAESEFPGGKYPSSVFLLSDSRPGTPRLKTKRNSIVIANLQKEKVDADALGRVKTRTRASLIRQLDDNAGLGAASGQLLRRNYGDWKKLFTELDDIDKVTADDVQRVAKHTSPENKTVAQTVIPAGAEGAKQ